MIKMIAGIYGYKRKDGTIEAKTVKSGPFECSKDEEARLVKLGIASYVEDQEAPEADDDGEPAEKPLEEMSKKELTEVAESLGVKIPARATNAQIIELINAAKAEHDSQGDELDDGEDGDDEPIPTPGAAMPE